METPEGPTVCTRCVLPDTFPGIRFDDHGVCKYCIKSMATSPAEAPRKETYRNQFHKLIADTKGRGTTYDVLMAFSGGKDSSYTLKLLCEKYDLRIAALTFDNHFGSGEAHENLHRVTDSLGVDLITIRPPWPLIKSMFSLTAQEDIFPAPTLLRASSICTSCIGMVKSIVLKSALEMDIPLVAYGWSPGQAPIQSAIMKNNPAMIRHAQDAHKKAFPMDLWQQMDRFFIPESYDSAYKERFPTNIHPLAFWEYDEATIIRELSELGWKKPQDTDSNSSNCLLNALGNHCHIARNGFHPYVWEIANMVRSGIMKRAEGIEKIYAPPEPTHIDHSRERLGL